eukprot:CAMPEP_0202494738 /NCGR_PEP_ID=MMETSP1361-20130828/13406_1 /ASSEMBLY_ACC=CAM_ASM_000849 /TAXON_ID=210615 /ORGANISM="Staurosira complex sp., Strain CCMP2646" /LENGTH=462 /DNA_ID=CAMNT_0049125415 /DNA_START=82 /DNA_END=1470 /DNA_ORIENTATION=+
MSDTKLELKSIETWFIHQTEKIRASAWTLPAASVIVAIALSQLTLYLDIALGASLLDNTDFLKIWTVTTAQALLSTIATSTLSLAGTAFSSIMVTMTLASQQFGPRLLRNFMKDRPSQLCLGVLMGTFVYCLFIIRGPRTEPQGKDEDFIPQISTIVAMALAIASLFFFIHFIQHVLIMIQEEQVIVDAYRGLQDTIRNIFPSVDAGEQERLSQPSDGEGWAVEAGKDGYIQAIDYEKLTKVARQYDAVLWIVCRSGWFITSRRTIARVIQGGEETDIAFIQAIQRCIYVGSNRTPEQDFEYGIRQLVEVCLRALSPGINDPFTAKDCLDYLGAALESVFARPLPASILRDGDDDIRVIKSITEYEGLVRAAIDQVRQASRTDCAVSSHLLDTLENVTKTARLEEQQQVLLDQATMIHHDSVPTMHNDNDRNAITSRYQNVVNACHLIPSAKKSMQSTANVN